MDQLRVVRDILDNLAECAESGRDWALAALFSDKIAMLVPRNDQIVGRLRKEGKREGGLESCNRLREIVW